MIAVTHYVFDFLLQSSWMAENKSRAWKPLVAHIGVYTLGLLLLCLLGGMNPVWGWTNGLAHGVTDYFTSRASSHFFTKRDYHWGFAVVGFDQLVHLLTMVWTWQWLS